MLLSVFLLLISVICVCFLKRSTKGRVLGVVISCLFAIGLVGFIAFSAAHYFTGDGIDDSVIYHIKFGLEGAGFVEYIGLIIAVSIALILTAISAVVVFRYIILKKEDESRSVYKILFLQIVLILTVIVHPTSNAVWMYLIPDLESASSAETVSFTKIRHFEGIGDYFSVPDLDESKGNSKNIVYIYLEGLEYTYFDEDIFPGLINNLRTLEAEGVSFRNIWQTMGAGWTIGGMVASQCGVPLVTASQGNSMSGMDSFLPAAYCLGDYLKEKDYTLSYIGGASKQFAGKGKFYESHGFDSVRGRGELLEITSDKKYLSWWGFYDDSVFDFVREEFKRAYQLKQPFGIFALTLDTHHPNGHASRSCDGIQYGDGENSMLNSVACSDYLIGKLVADLRKFDVDDNTIIVLASDHLAMRNVSTPMLQKGERRNTLIFLDPSVKSSLVSHKPGTTLDVAPTLLTMLGYEVDQFGFGVNLLGESETLRQKEKRYNKRLREWESELMRLWDFPQLGDESVVSLSNMTFESEGRLLDLPIMMTLNEELSVESVYFETKHYKGKASLAPIVSNLKKLKPESIVVWIDECLKLGGGGDGYCMFSGKLGAGADVKVIEDGYLVNKSFFGKYVDDEVSRGLFDEKIAFFESLNKKP